MEQMFCHECSNLHKITTHYHFCHTCSIISYNNYQAESILFFKSGGLGFISLFNVDSNVMMNTLGLESIHDLVDYFVEKIEFTPDHIFDLHNRSLRIKYLKSFLDIVESSPTVQRKAVDPQIVSSALIEVKYLLYGDAGRAEEIDPRKNGMYRSQFLKCNTKVIEYLQKIQSIIEDLHYCDSCDTFGPRGVLLNQKSIHPYDGCIWCIN